MATAIKIKSPITGKLVVGKKDIQESTLKYCLETLSNNPIAKEFESEINQQKEKTKHILEEEDGSFESQRETFSFIILKFRKSGKQNYHFFTRAGVKFQNTVFKLIQRMFTEEKFPVVFQNTTLHMIPKSNKGS